MHIALILYMQNTITISALLQPVCAFYDAMYLPRSPDTHRKGTQIPLKLLH